MLSTIMFSPYLAPVADDGDSDTESDCCTEMSIDSAVASSRTSVSFSMRSPSPVPSVLSFTSSLRAEAYRQEFGRGLNNYSDVYRLPADEEEYDRLDKQHDLFLEVMGKYPPPVSQIMTPDGFETKAVLDLGCGSGSWIMDVAREFPDCSAVAVDLVPMQSISMPPNCRSEVDDINFGLEHFYGDFNVVHCQLISSGIRDYQGMLDHISHVLRPGGLVDLNEFQFCLTGADKKPLFVPPGYFHPPWAAIWMSYVHRAIKDRGGDADAAAHMYGWLCEHPAFEGVVSRPFWFPCSPWMRGNDPETRLWNEIGARMREDVKAFLKSGRPLLLGYGLSPELVDTMESNAAAELDDAVIPLYVLVQNVYARKRQ